MTTGNQEEPATMHLHSIVYVSNMARSVAFYESLGLVRGEGGEPNPHWNEFGVGDAKLALHHSMGEELPAIGSRVELFLVVPGDGTLDRLHAAVSGAGEIADLGFGRHFRVPDPDGQTIFLLENPRQ